MRNRRLFNDLGRYTSMAQVWRHYPHGAHQGDYVRVGHVIYSWDAMRQNWMRDDYYASDAFRMMHQGGDLDLHGDIRVAGNMTVRQQAVVNGDLTVEGSLIYKHLQGHDCGLFETTDDLFGRWPSPRRGDWALVGTDGMLQLWICSAEGEWHRSAESADLFPAFQLDAYNKAKAIVDDIAAQGFIFGGVAVPTSLPHRPDNHNVFYLAAMPGEYVHFGGIYIERLSVILWHHETDGDDNGHEEGQWTATALMEHDIIGTEELRDGAVTTPKIADGAVTLDKTSGIRERFETIERAMVRSITINSGTKKFPDDQGNINLVISSGGGGGGADEELVQQVAINTENISLLEQEVAALKEVKEVIFISYWQNQQPNASMTEYHGYGTLYWYNPSANKLYMGELEPSGGHTPVIGWHEVETISDAIIYINRPDSTAYQYYQGAMRQIGTSYSPEPTPTPSPDYSDFITLGAPDGIIDSSTFETGKKYRVTGNYTLSEAVTIPPGVTIFVDGGIITGAYTLTGDYTVIIDTLNQIFDDDLALAGTWKIPFARPEWWGAVNTAVDYGSWPLRVYNTIIDDISGLTISDSASDEKVAYPHAYPSILVYEKGIELDVLPEYYTYHVHYDSTNKRFLFSPDGETYYTEWANDYEWNDPTGKARTDAVFLSMELGFTDQQDSTKSLGHIFTGDGRTREWLRDQNNGLDAAPAIRKAMAMGCGNVRLNGGCYYLESTAYKIRDYYHILIDAGYGKYSPLDDTPGAFTQHLFDGQGATLYAKPKSTDTWLFVTRSQVGMAEDDPEEPHYTVRNLKLTSQRVFLWGGFATGSVPNDITTSKVGGVKHVKGDNVTYENITMKGISSDFFASNQDNDGVYSTNLKIIGWKNKDSMVPFMHQQGTIDISLEKCDVTMRPLGDTNAHVFYFTVPTSRIRHTFKFLCRDSEFKVSDGYTPDFIYFPSTFGYDGEGTGDTNTKGMMGRTVIFERCRLTVARFCGLEWNNTLILRDCFLKSLGKPVLPAGSSTVYEKTPLVFGDSDGRFLVYGGRMVLDDKTTLRNTDASSLGVGRAVTHLENVRIESQMVNSGSGSAAWSNAFILTHGHVTIRNCSIYAPHMPLLRIPYKDYQDSVICETSRTVIEDNMIICSGYLVVASLNGAEKFLIANNHIEMAKNFSRRALLWDSSTLTNDRGFGLRNVEVRMNKIYTADPANADDHVALFGSSSGNVLGTGSGYVLDNQIDGLRIDYKHAPDIYALDGAISTLETSKVDPLTAFAAQLTTPPANPVAGAVFYDVSTCQLRVFTGTEWTIINSGQS